MKARAFTAVQGIAALICAFAIFGGTATADPGDVTALGGNDVKYCVSEDGSDGAGNANVCIDGVGLDTGVAAMAVTPDGTRLHATGFGGNGIAVNSNGNSISTYDRDLVTGEVELKPRLRACISQAGVAPCSTGGAGQLTGPSGLAISPNGLNVYVTARAANSLNVFDYIALPDPVNIGPLQQKAAGAGCMSSSGSGNCSELRGIVSASDVVISPDGDHVYTAGNQGNVGGIAVLNRAADGTLTQKGAITTPPDENVDGCVNDNGNNSCVNGNHVEPLKLAISADGKNLYAASQNPSGTNDAINVFDIAPDGKIIQKAGVAGCFSQTDLGGDCTPAPYLRQPTDISISPDGEYVYVTSDTSPNDGETSIGNLYVFGRNPDNGNLTSWNCFAAEAEFGCAETDGLYRPYGVLATNEAVYVTSIGRSGGSGGAGAKPGALVVLNRNPDDGTLTQKPFDGCWAADELDQCAELPTMVGARSLAISPSGDSLYVGGGKPIDPYGAITIFSRDDGVPPVTTIDSGPEHNGETSSNPVTFTFSADEPGSEFECAIDGGSPAFFPCTSPVSFSNLELGFHRFYVRAIDKSGNVEGLYPNRNFTLVKETDPPETTIDSGPQGDITATSASFAFSSDEPGTFECRMNAQAFAACTSPKQFTDLAIGAHTFEVRAIDAAENVDATPAQRSFNVVKETIVDNKVDATVTAAKVQKQKGKTIVVAVKIKANEALTAKLTGSVAKGKRKAAFKPVTRSLKPGTTTTLKLKPANAKAGRLVAAALLGSKRTVPKIFITLTDGATNRLVAKPKIKIQGAPKKR